MLRIARYVELFLGFFFILSAASKAINIDGFGIAISAYGVLKDPQWVRVAAYGSLIAETLLGAAFIAGWRWKGVSFYGASVLTLAFSGLIAYAWLVNGLEDCGCFGDYIKMTPPQSLAKNAVLIGVIAFAGFGLKDAVDSVFTPGFRTRVGAMASALAVVGIGVYGNLTAPEQPQLVVGIDAKNKDIAFQISSGGETIDLGSGEYLVVFLNTECEHCIASVPGLNLLNQEESLPKMVALMLGDDTKLDDFILTAEPEFTAELFDDLTWAKFIKSAPPIMYYVSDGMIEHFWEWEDDPPTVEVVKPSLPAETE